MLILKLFQPETCQGNALAFMQHRQHFPWWLIQKGIFQEAKS